MDAVSTMVTLLTDNWNENNTDELTPKIYEGHKRKREEARGEKSVIRVYQKVPHSTDFMGLGTADEETVDEVTVDILTFKSREHSIKLHTEVKRIMDANIIAPDDDYQLLKPIRLTDRNGPGFFHWIWDARLVNIAKTR